MRYSMVLGRDFLKLSNTKLMTSIYENVNEDNINTSFYGNIHDDNLENLPTNEQKSCICKVKRVLETNLIRDRCKEDNVNDHVNTREDFGRELLSIEYGDENFEYKLGNVLNFEQEREFFELFRTAYVEPMRPEEPKVKFEMRIAVNDDRAFNYPPRRLSYAERAELEKILDENIRQGFIRPSESQYASPIVLVRKKTGDLRMCIDFRRLNSVTIKDNFPIPLIDDLLDRLANKNIFSKLDLRNGFYHVYMHEDSIKYTAFTSPVGQFECLRMPFGLKNAPPTFQRFIARIFGDMIRDGRVVVYLDDIMVATRDVHDHMVILKEVFKRLVDNKLELRLDKCYFFHSEVKYLGYTVSKDGIRADKDGLEAIGKFPVPTRTQEVQTFLGMCSYFRRFIRDFSIMAKPLYDLTRKNSKFEFGELELNAFTTLKEKLMQSPILAIYDPRDETELHCDASSIGFGAILLQKKGDGKFHPIFYFSKRTSEIESRYHSFELETLAIVYALRRFRVYLQGINFKIITDCNSLTLTLNKKELNPRIARWALELQNYEFRLEHRVGTKMQHVDALSRSNAIMVIEDNTFEDNLVICQNNDEKLKKIKEALSHCEQKFYEMRNGVLYRKFGDDLVFYVPESMEQHVIYKYHDEMGHLGVDKVTEIIRRSYWFPNIRRKVEDHIRNCLKCIAFSAKSGKREGFLHIIPKGKVPFQVIHIDHYGPIYSKLSRGHILVIVDACTKFVRLYPTRTTKSKEAIDALSDYFRAYSRPACIVSDRGSCFNSDEFTKFLQDYNIDHIRVATGSPEANGQVERINRDLGPMISKLINVEENEKWCKVLPEVEFALNNTVHRGIGQHPSIMLFGVNQRGKVIDSLKENVVVNVQESRERNVKQIRSLAEEVQVRSQNYNKSYVDSRRIKPNVFKIGDYVMVRNFNSTVGASSKLVPKFKGPYRISAVLGNDRYCVEDVEGFQRTRIPYKGVWAVYNMKPWIRPRTSENDLSRYSDDDSFTETHSDDIRKVEDLKQDNTKLGTDRIVTRGMSARIRGS